MKIDDVPPSGKTNITDYPDPATPDGETGDQAGGIMHHISVSPTKYEDKATGKFFPHIAFGILVPFGSFNGGKSWQLLRPWPDDNPAVHKDIHRVYFDPVKAGRLFIASDGGLISTADNGKSFWSYYYNKYLHNLMFLGIIGREFYGRLSASYAIPIVVGGGLMDNGDVYLTMGTWKQLTGGDGGQVLSTLEHDFIHTSDPLSPTGGELDQLR